ncbi:ATP-binding protein [Saccharopolyspora rhizosphaerae]|uniref:ATP-binding protein n=1 Tax=Saccharopolyspora rhizosphaerae TaxID=2492662 RepID=A0A426K3G5_9PSEU|nr:ATP-binding protein [Saccharopolyspora rhizosphaerae]RRO19914.1 ATP-binding protein [Saccharopolyspora rhizosphaerae]
MNTQTAQVDDLRLIALPSAVNCTEMFVRFSLAEWSLREMVDTATQLTGALVTAAVDAADQKNPGFITVRLRLSGESLVAEVQDEQATVPPQLAPGFADGRCGATALRTGGTLVWCEMPLPSGVKADSVPLPRRSRKKNAMAPQTTEETAEVDPEVIKRLLSGLSNGGLD